MNIFRYLDFWAALFPFRYFLICDNHLHVLWETMHSFKILSIDVLSLHISGVELLCPFLLSDRAESVWNKTLNWNSYAHLSVLALRSRWDSLGVTSCEWQSLGEWTQVENCGKPYCFSQQDQLLSNNNMCSNICQNCISSCFLRRRQRFEWVTSEHLGLVIFTEHQAAYVCLLNAY